MSIIIKDGNNVNRTFTTTTDSAGNLTTVHSTEGQKATYSAAKVALATVTSATDVFTLTGSASKTIRVTQVRISGTIDTAAQYVNVALNIHSSANTAGTSSAVTAIPHDSADAAATGTVLSYTGNPTIGTSLGAVRAARYFAPLSATAAPTTELVFDFTTRNARGIVLRGTAQQLAINLGTTANSGVFDISIEWTEE